MEPHTRFDLNAAIQKWQQELAAQPGLNADNRRELEAHLRDAIAELRQRGLNEEEAFWLARRRVGPARQLSQEFSKGTRIGLKVLFSVPAIFFAAVLVGVWLPAVNRIQDLGASGAGLELGEWQVSVGGYLFAAILFTVLALSAWKARFPIRVLIVSWLTLLGVGAATASLYSIRGRTGFVNQFGHGLTYGEWWASVIPWTIAVALIGLLAIWSLVYAFKSSRDLRRAG